MLIHYTLKILIQLTPANIEFSQLSEYYRTTINQKLLSIKFFFWTATLAYQILRKWFAPLFLLSIAWVVLARAQSDSWVIGIPAILLALLAFSRLRQPYHSPLNLKKLPGFLAWFLWNSIRGGIDVSQRALQRKMPLCPGFIEYHLNAPEGSVRVFFINSVSLLPGTLSADMEGNTLIVHALDTSMDIVSDTREVEIRVLDLFNLKINEIKRGKVNE